jgi:CHASE3 domain sensor protein
MTDMMERETKMHTGEAGGMQAYQKMVNRAFWLVIIGGILALIAIIFGLWWLFKYAIAVGSRL